jgi:fucose 4-O-acetylase-like acetyltransferase
MASTSKRSKFFDNAKFILIFLVVFGHVISPLKEHDGILYNIYSIIYLFHMPAFIFISGYFSKGFQQKGYFSKLMKKLLLPYVIFQIMYSGFYYLTGKDAAFHVDILQPHWSLWFLLSMVFWNFLLIPFAKLRWYGLPIAILLGILVGYIDSIGSYLSLSRTFVFFPYFFAGYLISSTGLKQLLGSKYSRPAGILILIAAVSIFGGWPSGNVVPWLLGDNSFSAMGNEQAVAGLYRTAQYFLTTLVIFGFLTLIPSIQFSFTEIGERTLYIYLFHGFIIKPVQAVIPEEGIVSVTGNYLLLLGFSFIVCLLLGSYLVKKFTRPLVEPKLPLGSNGN